MLIPDACRDMLSLSRLHLKLTHLLGSSEISMDKLQDKQDDKRGKRLGRAEVEVGGARWEVRGGRWGLGSRVYLSRAFVVIC